MTGFDFGDVVLVPFPFTSQSAFKRRPAVVVSTRSYNVSRPDVIVMAITSQLPPDGQAGDVLIRLWQSAGLLKASCIKPVVATLEQSIVIRKLGVLEPDDARTLERFIASILGSR
ncbi:MAG: type II toxin-antitoxin system PemK/MazF family toxin [Rhodospirillaceae bacterium]|nr:type II toxin-antitoxin system PemK/MazF family toxin [Rhodospirillaceae bacterium]